MPLNPVDLHAPLQPLDWFVPGLFVRGYLTFVASLPGQGKTALLTALAWQASRLNGTFLGEPVSHGATVYVNFDAPGEGRSMRYWLEKHKAASPDGDINMIHVLEPDADTFGMGEVELAALETLIREKGVSLIIIDSFMAAFPTTDPSKLTAVQGPLWYMRRLASETGAAVVLIDHLPKPINGEVAGTRGVMGSVAKAAQARAVHLLTRVPPHEVQGRTVIRWAVSKMSFAEIPEPFGVELLFDGDGLCVEGTTLPQSQHETKTERAVRTMVSYLEHNVEKEVSRKELLEVAIKDAGVSMRSAAGALPLLQERLGDAIRTVAQPGRGNPISYRLVGEKDTRANTGQGAASVHQEQQSVLQEATSLMQPALHQELALHKETEELAKVLVEAK